MSHSRAESVGERVDLRCLQPSREINEHRVARDERFLDGRCVPRMQVGANLGRPARLRFLQDADRPGMDCHLIRREIRGAHCESLEQPIQAWKLPHVFHGDPGAGSLPVVFFDID